jgi:hypothetical protein
MDTLSKTFNDSLLREGLAILSAGDHLFAS